MSFIGQRSACTSFVTFTGLAKNMGEFLFDQQGKKMMVIVFFLVFYSIASTRLFKSYVSEQVAPCNTTPNPAEMQRWNVTPSELPIINVTSNSNSSSINHIDVKDDAVKKKCKCIHCEEDDLCGGLWEANKFPPAHEHDTANRNHTHIAERKIHMIVSHCKRDLSWTTNFTKGHDVASIIVISKCGNPVVGAPERAIVLPLPNVGRCDHSYAFYITTLLDQQIINDEDEDSSIIVFAKDDMDPENVHQGDFGSKNPYLDFDTLIKLASSVNGFSCGLRPPYRDFTKETLYNISAYHDTETWFNFTIMEYPDWKGFNYTVDEVPFASNYPNLKSFYESLHDKEDLIYPPSSLVQVCYGGIFATTVSSIRRTDMSVWRMIQRRLSRGNNIQEGHYMERLWAYLLSKSLEPYQVETLRNQTDRINEWSNPMAGSLLRLPNSTVF